MSAALRILLLLAAGLLLAPASASAHVFPENRVRGVSDYPSGQHVETLALTPETATGCASCPAEIVSGRALWLSRDPIGEAGGLNLYGYVGNNPINFRDPLGLDAAAAARALGELGTVEEGEEGAGWLGGGNFNPIVDGALAGTAIIGGGIALWEYFQPTSVCMSNSGERGIQGKDPNPWKGYRPKDPKDPSKGGQKQDPQTGKWKPVPRPQGPPPPNHPTW